MGITRLARRAALLAGAALSLGPLCLPAQAAQFFFSTGNPDGKLALASRPASGGSSEIEAADDFALTDAAGLEGASFTGLIPPGASLASIQQVRVEIYRVFPADSDATRASQVPTRVNSPSDVDTRLRSSTDGSLSFIASVIGASFTTSNSVLNGIHPAPNQLTGGEGPVTGQEVAFNVVFGTPVPLASGHYFFVPQVRLSAGDFFWLSAARPIVPPGTPFPSGATDVQSWTRNAALDPDWLRVGADIIGGATTFNGAFSLSGEVCQPIALSPAGVPAATAGAAYAVSFDASGGLAPYSFSETGALPAGLALAGNGSLAGTPTQSGTFPAVIQATDASGCTGTTDVTLNVAPAAPGTQPASTVPPGVTSAVPSITAARLSPKTFRAAGRGATLARTSVAPVGTTVTYRDSQAATTTFTVLRPVTGHRSGSKCLAGRPRKRQKRCTRYASLGATSHRDAAGSVSVRFGGRVRGHKLSPGRYLMTLTPKAGGATGRTVRLAFRIVK